MGNYLCPTRILDSCPVPYSLRKMKTSSERENVLRKFTMPLFDF